MSFRDLVLTSSRIFGRLGVPALMSIILASCAPAKAASDPAQTAAAASSAGRAGPGKNGEVDVQFVVLNCRRGKEAKARLRAIFDRSQADLDQRQDAIKALRKEIEEAPPSEERDRKLSRWNAEIADLRETFERYNRQLKNDQDTFVKPIFEDLMDLLPRLAAEVGAHAIYDKRGECKGAGPLDRRDCIPWGRTGRADGAYDAEWLKPRVDLTDRAIEALDK